MQRFRLATMALQYVEPVAAKSATASIVAVAANVMRAGSSANRPAGPDPDRRASFLRAAREAFALHVVR